MPSSLHLLDAAGPARLAADSMLATLTATDAARGWSLDGNLLGAMLLTTLIALPFLASLFYAGYFVFSLPLRRQERSRLFLDLLETAIHNGGSMEAAIVGAARRAGSKLGKPLVALAARLSAGLPLAPALEATPQLLPPPVVALLRAGAELGDLPKAIQAARRLLREGTSPLLKAQHYLMLLAFVTSPGWIVVFCLLTIFVLPKLQQIYLDMADTDLTGLMSGLIAWRHELLAVQAAIFLSLWCAALLYWGGPSFKAWLQRHLPLPWSRLALSVPWHRHRLLRDFTTLLGAALDAGLPEPRAVMLAAEGSANETLRQRAVTVLEDLQAGTPLPRALRHLDGQGELAWRIENAAHGGDGFAAALAGWEEALDARAFQQEQTVAQLVTTGLVLLNGVFVALLTAALFQMLTQLITSASLW